MELVRHELYGKFLNDSLPSNYDALGVRARFRVFKEAMRKAANLVRKWILVSDSNSALANKLLMMTIARAVHSQNAKHFYTILNSCPAVGDIIGMDEDNKIFLRDPEDFARRYDEARSAALADQQRQLRSDSNKFSKKVGSLMRAARRWSPFSKRVYLAALTAAIGGVDVKVTDPIERDQMLHAHWKPVFETVKDIDEERATAFLKDYASPWGYSDVEPPRVEDFKACLRHAKNSFPSPDGFPFAAWFYAGDRAYRLLADLNDLARSGQPISIDFNVCAMVYAVKGQKDEDVVEVIRSAAETRSLSL